MNVIGKKCVFIIAEAGVNHNGQLEPAYQLVDKAKEAGADAVKFQTFNPKKLVSKVAKMATYQKNNIGKEKSQQEMLTELTLEKKDFLKIKEYCDEKKILFLSTPFDEESADFLKGLIPYYKIGSGEITNLPFLKHVAKKGKPIILSTGMSFLGEVETAVKAIQEVDHGLELYLLHCTTNYPCPINEVNLKAMLTLKEAFKLPVGYSDHTKGIEVPIAAVAMGAKIIEKHFTLDNNMEGPDHKASLEPDELKEMVLRIRNIEKALGDGIKKPNESELKIREVARKVLVSNKKLNQGSVIRKEDIDIKRAGCGISPYELDIVVNRKLVKDIDEDDPLTWEHFLGNHYE